MLSEPQRCSLRTGAPLKSSLRQCKIGSGVAIDRTQGIHKLLRAFDVFEERAQAKDRKQRAFMRFQLGHCINSLAQLLDELFACAQDIQLTAYNQLMFFDHSSGCLDEAHSGEASSVKSLRRIGAMAEKRARCASINDCIDCTRAARNIGWRSARAAHPRLNATGIAT